MSVGRYMHARGCGHELQRMLGEDVERPPIEFLRGQGLRAHAMDEVTSGSAISGIWLGQLRPRSGLVLGALPAVSLCGNYWLKFKYTASVAADHVALPTVRGSIPP